jgi:hypothetical protein
LEVTVKHVNVVGHEATSNAERYYAALALAAAPIEGKPSLGSTDKVV